MSEASIIDAYINETLECSHIKCYPITMFTIEDLTQLAEKAKDKNILMTIKVEHSNFYNGALVNLIRKDIILSYFDNL